MYFENAHRCYVGSRIHQGVVSDYRAEGERKDEESVQCTGDSKIEVSKISEVGEIK